MENLKTLEIRINKIEKKLLKQDLIDKKKLLKKLAFLITRAEEMLVFLIIFFLSIKSCFN